MDVHRGGPQDECGQVRQEADTRELCEWRLQSTDRRLARMTSSAEAMADLAGRLEGMIEELTDIALDALRRGASGDPDSAETGEALAIERRVVRARRSIERA